MSGASAGRSLRGKRVLLTGHTGFKGSWLALMLHQLGAEVHGLALDPEGPEDHFVAARVGELLASDRRADVRSASAVQSAVREVRPHAVFHLAAQALVRRAYRLPLETYEINVQGTANLLDALRVEQRECAVIVVTSDKVYANDGRSGPYREGDRLGGHDPYSASKAAAELVVDSYRSSFFPADSLAEHGVALATARAGNVIGGGDRAEDRLIPDCVRSWSRGEVVDSRSPRATRPWQHVLEPLTGYLRLADHLMAGDAEACTGWNFGPRNGEALSVAAVLDVAVAAWPGAAWQGARDPEAPHEAAMLALDSSRAEAHLGHVPHWSTEEAVRRAIAWYRDVHASPDSARERSLADIRAYTSGP